MRNLPETIYYPGSEFTIEKNTGSTPSRNRYFIIKSGEVVSKGFTNLAQARKAIQPFLDAIGWTPPPLGVEQVRSPEESLREEINWREDWRSEMFVAESGYHARGGKLSNR